ncbi:MAG: alpha/beta hydrolase [Kiritimatiellae bacterium]|nr:alpha/beta hydrolase [Kiritimatiellia bacterium]
MAESGYLQSAGTIVSGGYSLSATLIRPQGPTRLAVLFLPPLFEERKGTLPLLVQSARSWAELGIASLIFDYAGCGDSEGEFADIDPGQFLDDADAALRWLRGKAPVPVALVGVRVGCCLAAPLAARQPGVVAAAVFWAPVGGDLLLRQLFQRRMVNDMVAYGKARESRKDLTERLTVGGAAVDLDGYMLSAAVYGWLTKQTIESPKGVSVLVARGSSEAYTPPRKANDASQLELRFPPFWNTVGHVELGALVAATGEWLEGFSGTRIYELPEFGASDVCHSLPVRGKTLRMAVDRPSGPPKRGLLLLHGWSGDRTGPHRMFVRFARLRAAEGTLCVRPDFIGRGLSDGESSDATIADMAEDSGAALEWMKAQLPEGVPLEVLAICSGCKVAISLAVSHPEVARLWLWSAESMGSLRHAATGLRKTLQALKTYAGKALRPETWRKLLKGKVNTGLVTKALVKHETRSPEEARREDATLAEFRKFRNPVCFVFGGSDPDTKGSSEAYSRFCRKNGIPFTLNIVPNSGHSYYGEEWTQQLFSFTSEEA